MERFGRGDEAAFEALYLRHEASVFRFLLRQLRRDPALANDVLQDVWFAVARSAGRYRPSAKFTTWLFTIAHHRMVDAIRAHRPMEALAMDPASDDALPRDPEPAAGAATEPLHAVESGERAAALLGAVERLPPDQRAAFLLQAEGRLSVEEIAAATGASFETTKSRLRYARAKLRESLAEFA